MTFQKELKKEIQRLQRLEADLQQQLQEARAQLGKLLSLDDDAPKAPARRGRKPSRRSAVLELIKTMPNGMGRGEIIASLGLKGDKSAEQSVSNALTLLKKSGQIKRGADRKYITTE